MASRFAETADEESEEDASKARRLTLQEKAIYLEGDALQIEMGNIVMRSGAGGNVLYDVAGPISTKTAIPHWPWRCATLRSWKRNVKEGFCVPWMR